MIRTIIAFLFVVVFLILSIPIMIVEWILRKFNRYAADISSLRIVQWAFKVVLFICGTKLTVLGEENIPTDTPVLYIGNHRGYFDIVITYARCKGLTGYISKDTLDKVPLLNIWMRRLYCLFLDRKDLKKGMKTILTGIDQIKNGISMCIFPEGTRGKSKSELDMNQFKPGSFKLAEKTGCPIIPMAITGSSEILEDHLPFVHKTHVILQYGKPIILSELSAKDQKQIASYTQSVILEMLKDNENYK